ncbi:MAG: phenylalanine--tRNA ligase subunit beta [Oscillospiraceae bacterium]|nr:phenylalanine--tRNA ligase subunit beta [Oscillospiraceae bacterium]
MNLSMKWLNDFVKVDVPPKQFCEDMTMSGSKVEGFELENANIKNVVVGKIISVEKHPDADKLHICQLDVGKGEPIQIVTGADNIFSGAIVPVALDGSLLPNGTKIKKGKLRGVESNGMLCSLGELNLTVNDFPYAIEDGIFIMEEECEIGQDICSAIGLDDTCVEFEITSNRPDCLSVIGLAKEAAATYKTTANIPMPEVKNEISDKIEDMLSVDVQNKELCQRYIAKVVKNVKIAPSPRWMRERLRASGVRPINNIVDITNYVMLEYGNPMHAFDYKYVDGGKIVVRNAKDGEKITTLDGVERNLSSDMLVIADSNKPVAVAGVMGGEFSGIMDDTTTVVFESACFFGSNVRRTSKKLGLRTESSGRFEKGLDPANTYPAVLRACELVEMLGAGEVVSGIIDINNTSSELRKIAFEPDWTNNFLGINLSKDEMIDILTSLSFEVKDDMITVPSFRTDIEHKADIAEEIARIYGYNNIPSTAIRGVAQGKLTDKQKFYRLLEETLIAMGSYEIQTYSFISPKYYDNILLPKDSPLRECVVISNPLGEDTSVMRTTAVPSMLDIIAKNNNNRTINGNFYEIATEYTKTSADKLPIEKDKLLIGLYGEGYDFYVLKGMIETVLDKINIKDYDVEPVCDNPTFHPGRTAKITVGDEVLGILGEIHPLVCKNYDISSKVYVADFDIEVMMNLANFELEYKPLPKFPAVTRDIALICDDEITIGALEKAIKGACPRILEKINLFDVYKGKQIPDGKKSVAFSLVFRSKDATLTDAEVDSATKKILKALSSLGAEIRS